MTFSKNAVLLRGLTEDSPAIALGVTHDDVPAGLGLAFSRDQSAEVLSLFIVPQFWSRGLGTQLLQSLEQILKERGCLHVSMSYTTQSPSLTALERILQKQGWSRPRLDVLLTRVTDEVTHAPWVQ